MPARRPPSLRWPARARRGLPALVVTALVALCGPAAGAAGPARTAPAVLESGPVLAFADAEHGWWAPDPSVTGSYGGVLWATDDGGATWHPAEETPAEISVLDALDDTHVWIVSGDALLGSSDGGATWRTVDPDLPQPVATLGFVSQDAGSLLTEAGALWQTSDGGATWHPAAPGVGDLDTACFTSGGRGFESDGRTLAVTADGGRHWQVHAVGTGPAAGPVAGELTCSRGGAAEVVVSAATVPAAAFGWVREVGAGRWQGAPLFRLLPRRPAVPAAQAVLADGTAVLVTQPCNPCADAPVVAVALPRAGRATVATVVPAAAGGAGPEPVALAAAGDDLWLLVHEWAPSGASGAAAPRSVLEASSDGGRTWQTRFASG